MPLDRARPRRRFPRPQQPENDHEHDQETAPVLPLDRPRRRFPRRQKTDHEDDNDNEHEDDYGPTLITTTTGR